MAAAVLVWCPKHKGYKAARSPTSGCTSCIDMWMLRQLVEGGSPDEVQFDGVFRWGLK